MSLLVFVVVTFAFAGLAAVLRGDPGPRTAAGLIGLIVAVVAALAIDPAQVVDIRGGGIATTAYLRLFLVLGSLVGLGLAVSGLAGGSRRDAPAVTLAILAAVRPDPRPRRRRGRRCSSRPPAACSGSS